MKSYTIGQLLFVAIIVAFCSFLGGAIFGVMDGKEQMQREAINVKVATWGVTNEGYPRFQWIFNRE